jgi:hypothetical protein
VRHFSGCVEHPSRSPFLLNYIVDDLDAILAKLASNGVRIDPKRENYDYGPLRLGLRSGRQ